MPRPDQDRPGSDDLDGRLLPDHALRAQALRVRPDPEHARRAAGEDPAVDRAGRERTRRGAPPARGAPRADRSGPRPGGGDPRRRSTRRRRATPACQGGDRSRPPAAARRNETSDRGRDAPCTDADPRRGRRAHTDRDGEGDREGARRRRPPASDRGRRPGPRLLCPGAGEHQIVIHRTYAQALFDAAKEQGRLGDVQQDIADFAAAVHDVPELRTVLRNPQLDPRAKSELLEQLAGDADELVRNFLRLTAEKGRIGEIEEIAREFDRLMAIEERRLNVELTTAYELSDDEARSVLNEIEKASGRKIEATRKVDPGLIGGFVLRAGSMRVDASVRGRLNRLREELVTSR